jgi:tetratricopeptide (TPR) repeat protein
MSVLQTFKKDFDILPLVVRLILNTLQCYKVLGLKPGASIKEIKDAYRNLVLRYHPDKDSSEGNEERFLKISDAYQTLRVQCIPESKTPKFGDIYPEDAVYSYEQAEKLLLKQKYEDAIVFFNKTLEKLPRYANAWLKKGDTLSSLKRYDEALYCYDKVLQINPESADAWNLKGICLSDLKRYDEALDAFDEAILLDPTRATTWNFKGVCFFTLEKLGEALKCFDRAIKLSPKFAVAWHNKGRVLLKLGKNKEAEKCHEKVKNLRQ